MSIVYHVPVSALPKLEAEAWRHDVLRRSNAGERLITIYGRALAEFVEVTSVFMAADGALDATRTRASAEVGMRALTPELPAAHCFERELHEQTSVHIAEHPWLKPLRFERGDQSRMNDYPFYACNGKEVHQVAVGPVHAGVIEPGSFRFLCLGERVHHLEVQLGYQHRGVEAALLQRVPHSLGQIVETIAGDSSVAHAWAYCAAMEALGGCVLETPVEIARAVALELERVAMHLSGLSGLAADIGFLQGASTYGRLRTTAINTTMLLCGSRFGRRAVRLGGHGMRASEDLIGMVRANLELLLRDLEPINALFVSAKSVRHRLRDVGVVSEETTRALGLVGMVARAAGVNIDLRATHSTGAYAATPIDVSVLCGGDCMARAQIRIAELDLSIQWLQRALQFSDGWTREPLLVAAPAPNHLAIALVEGWRGEVVHCVETGADGRLLHYKLQDPSLRNWLGLAIAVRGNEISDFPICNKSFDLSYCGNDL